jgi:RNA polymerase sigma factor (sigma-70 family)
MKKTIILKNGVKKEMTYEEVLKQFTPMINRATNIAMNKFNTIDREEMLQEMKLEAWKAFDEYDEIHAFSTLLTWKLKKVTGNEAQKITAQKRTSYGVVSMNQTVGDAEDLTMEDMFAADVADTSESMVAKEMMDLILPQLDERERKEFHSMLHPEEYNMADLAKELGMSRPAARQHLKKTQAKIQNILIENHYVA